MNQIEQEDSSGNPPIRVQRACLEIDYKSCPIYDGINTIGRNPNAVINIENINVSKHHAVIVVIDENQHFLSDTKSSNSTFLNSNHVHPFSLYQLNDNDVIKFGNITTVYKRNDTDLDARHTDTASSQTISQSFYAATTQDVELVNDFHEMDTQVFDNNEHCDFHDLPTQVEDFDIPNVHKNATTETESTKENASVSDVLSIKNIQIGELHLSEALTENFAQNSDEQQENFEIQELEIIVNDNRNDEETSEIVNRDAASTENLQNKIVDDYDTSNDSLVFVHIHNVDRAMKNDQEDESNELDERSIQQTTENNDESSNESLDLVTMQKITQIQNKSDTVSELTQQIKPMNLTNNSMRISDSHDDESIENQNAKQKPLINSDDETDIEDDGDIKDDNHSEPLELTQQIKPVVLANTSRRLVDSDGNGDDDLNEDQHDKKETDIEDDDDNANQSNLLSITHMNQSDIIPATQNIVLEPLELTQTIKPVILANTSRRISDGELNENEHVDKEQSDCIISNDKTDNEDDDDNADQSNLLSITQMNQSDIIPATQNIVDLEEKQTTGVIEDSFQDSSFAIEINETVFETTDPNKADEEDIFNQSTQRLNIELIEKHRNDDNIDEIYVQATQKIDDNTIDEIANSNKQDPEVSIDEGNNRKCKDNSSDCDLFALPATPKKQRRSKTNIEAKPSTSKDVEDELQDLFATQQTHLTCSQLVHILADSPTKQSKIQIVNNNHSNCNRNKTSDNQTNKTERVEPIITVNDEKLEEELGTLFQSQADFTCSQLVQILDDPKDGKSSTIRDSLETESDEDVIDKNNKNTPNVDLTVKMNSQSDEENQIVEKHRKTDLKDENQVKSADRTLKRKFSKMASDREIEISKPAKNEKNKKLNLINSKTDSQSSTDSNSSADYFVAKSTSNPKKRQNLNSSSSLSKSENEVENKVIKRTTRQSLKHSNDSNSNSQSSVGSASSEDYVCSASKTNARNRKKSSTKMNSSEETGISKSTTDDGRTSSRRSRKRSANSADISNISTKIRLDQNTNILKVGRDASIIKEAAENDLQSSVSTDLSSTQTAIQKNKMSRRTRKNPNNTTIQLLPVTVTVPRKQENCENEQQKPSIVTRSRPPKNNNESISTPPDSSASSSSSSTTKTTKTTNIRKGKRRLSANSRSMKNLEKIDEQIENKTVTTAVRRKRNLQQDQELEQTKVHENNETISTPERSRRKLKPKVVFTMMDNPELESLIRQLGGMIVDSVDACTVLVTGQVKRSCKLLSAVGQGKPICSPQWLLDSKKASIFLNPWNYILEDNEAEEKWNFKLHESLERSNRKKIMENYTFQLFVNQAADVLKGAIESCGGKCVTRYSPRNCNSNFIIVANPGNCSKYNKIIKQNPDILVVAPEAIFDGVLRQELQFDRHSLL